MNVTQDTIVDVKSHAPRNPGGKYRFVVVGASGAEYTTFQPRMADLARRFINQTVGVQWQQQQRGNYTNIYFEGIDGQQAPAPEQSNGDVQNAPPPVQQNRGGGGNRSEFSRPVDPATQARMARSVGLQAAVAYAALDTPEDLSPQKILGLADFYARFITEGGTLAEAAQVSQDVTEAQTPTQETPEPAQAPEGARTIPW